MRKSPLFDADFLETQLGTPEEYRKIVEEGIALEIESQVKKYYFD